MTHNSLIYFNHSQTADWRNLNLEYASRLFDRWIGEVFVCHANYVGMSSSKPTFWIYLDEGNFLVCCGNYGGIDGTLEFLIAKSSAKVLVKINDFDNFFKKADD